MQGQAGLLSPSLTGLDLITKNKINFIALQITKLYLKLINKQRNCRKQRLNLF